MGQGESVKDFRERKKEKEKEKKINRKRGWGIITKQVFLMVAGRNPNPCI